MSESLTSGRNDTLPEGTADVRAPAREPISS